MNARSFDASKVVFDESSLEGSIPRCFESIVARLGNHPAVVAGDRSLSYDELNTAANRVASAILARPNSGGAPPIALLMEHGIEIVAAILGVLKAGRAYSALNPSFPIVRNRFVIDDLLCDLVLTDAANVGLAQRLAGPDRLVIVVDSLDPQTQPVNPYSSVTAESLAAVFYTSGTEGRPKGVERSHGDLLHRCLVERQVCPPGPGDVVSMLYPNSAAASIPDLFGSLLGGATLCVHNLDRLGPPGLAAWLSENGITHLHLHTSVLRLLLDSLPAGAYFSTVRHVRPSDRLAARDVDRLRRMIPVDASIVHGLACTEAGLITQFIVDDTVAELGAVTPVGFPVPGVEVLVVDDSGAPVPPGQVGEIVARGRYVTRGYWRRPELTDERIQTDRLDPGVRSYRLGDLGRMRPDGCLDLVGRKDRMVKIRGHRVELDEVETALQRLESVQRAAIVVSVDGFGDQTLVAYVQADGVPLPLPGELREQLQVVLPASMIPGRIVVVDHLPVLPNGKIDRQALPAIDNSRPMSNVTYVAPRTPLETELAAIWAEALGLDQVGIYDRFLDLGGHSLQAARIVGRVVQIYQTELSLRVLFDSPTIADMAQQIERQLLRSDSSTPPLTQSTAGFSTIPRRASEGSAPLSFAQERLWFLAQLYPGQIAYNEASAFRFVGDLDPVALQAALDGMVKRHEILRTTYHWQNSGPVQRLGELRKVPMDIVDLTDLAADQRIAEAHTRFQQAIEEPFDLENDLMLRASLYRLNTSDHILLIVRHHIAVDGWSARLFWNEMLDLYAAQVAGLASHLPALTVQYADYAVWQRSWLEGERLERQLGYWRIELADLPLLDLPTDLRRMVTPSFRGAAERFSLFSEVVELLRDLARQESTTLNTVLLATYAVFLSRTATQDDFAIGLPVAGRIRPELEPLMGFFVNTLVIRARLGGNPSFRDVLRQMRETTLAALDHQDVPFEKLVEALEIERRLDRTPLISTAFQLYDHTAPRPDLSGLLVEPVEIASLPAKFDLECSLVNTAEGLAGTWRYAADLFQPATVRRMIGHFQTLVSAIAEDPDCAIGQLPMLTDAEQRQVLVDWNPVATTTPITALVHERFEAQVVRSPDAIAVSLPMPPEGAASATELTYRELNRRANQLAHALRKLGVGPETLVALYMERSLELVIAILGVLKAGGAYVPLDPANPPDRLALLIEDSNAPVAISQHALAGTLSLLGLTRTKVICLDSDWSLIEPESDQNLTPRATPDSTAYVIYTSGSSGKPKGVMVTHSNVARLFRATERLFDFDARDVWTLFHSVAFDFSVWELWGGLLYGGRVVIIPHSVRQSPALYFQLLCDERVTVLNQTPSAFHQLMRAEEVLDQWSELALRYVMLGGEVLDLESLRPWFRRHGDLRPVLVNLYGPTETTVLATYRPLRAVDVDTARGSNIGRPLPDLQVYVLNPQRRLAPIGVTGELYIGGAGLARGYLNQPDLTSQRFVPASSVAELWLDGHVPASQRLYRTGDLVRWLPNGDLEFIGRTDNQVKIRGFRVELGEIETVLAQHPFVGEGLVLAREDKPGDLRLVAYFVPAADNPVPVIAELRAFLKEKLPDYMVPSHFVTLQKFPLTANGKIDRAALPTPDAGAGSSGVVSIAPRSPEEESVASIWSEVLGLSQIGVHDNFFDMGGHSLLAVQVVARIARVFEVDVPVRVLFDNPTVARFASCVTLQRLNKLGDLDSSVGPILPRSHIDAVPLSFAQQRMWFLYQLEPLPAAYHMPGAYRLTGNLNIPVLERSLRTIVQRHEALRTVFKMHDGALQQVVLEEFDFSLPVIDISCLPQQEWDAVAVDRIVSERDKPFDLTRDVMMRAVLLHLDTDDYILSVVTHHIASDGWSMSIFWRELAEAYAALVESKTPDFLPLTIRYTDYTIWQQEWLQGQRLERQLAYWREQLNGVVPLNLPTDRPRPAEQSHRGASSRFTVPRNILDELHLLSMRASATVFMTLLTAMNCLMQRYSGQNDIAIGTVTANRRRPEIEGMIGFFLNTLVLRNDLSGDPTFSELLTRVRRVTLDSYDHQDVPFERLLIELQPEREPSRTPLYQVLVVLQNMPPSDFQLTDLKTQALQLPHHTSKLDLSLYMTEMPAGLECHFEFNADLFDVSTIDRMAVHFQTLLESIVADPDQSIKKLGLLPEVESAQVLETWNDTAVDYSGMPDLVAQFRAQVAARPNETAFVCRTERLTFVELNDTSNRLARYLLAQGIQQGDRIGVCLERSLDVPVALMAILKVGGVYTPLDPSYPAERLRFILADAGVATVITETRWLPRLISLETEAACWSSHCLDTLEDALQSQSAEDLIPSLSPTSIAYIIYTSGSTGLPKGVIAPHRQILNRLAWMWQRYPFEPGEVGCQKTALNFVDSLWELLGYTLQGVPTVIVPDEDVRDPYRLLEILASAKVSRLWLVPSMFRALLDSIPDLQRLLPSLRFWVSSGEALTTELFQRFRKAMPDGRLYNLYGTSEAWDVTWFDPNEPQARWNGVFVPIGRPISNLRTAILDRDRQPVPIGIPGELWVSGDGLSDGYINRPDLTAERFAAPQWIDRQERETRRDNTRSVVWSPTDRLYRTGDLARWLPDGNIEFCGRADSQVKVRGHRIEPGEIETCLNQHPAVRQSVVILHAPGTIREALVAYYVPGEGTVPSAVDLASFLSARLPSIMVPSRFIPLDALPMTPSGKVDRAALAAADGQPPGPLDGYAPPRTHVEAQLVELWAEVLELEKVGIHDQFFDIGGHSLLGILLFSRIEEHFGQRLPLSFLFSASTVAKLAEYLEQLGSDRQPTTLVPIQSGGSLAPFFCVHGFGGGVLGYADLARLLGPNRPFYGLQAAGLTGDTPADLTIEAMASRYIAAMRLVQPRGPYRVGGYCFGAVVAYEMARQLEAIGERTALVAIMEGYAPKRYQRRASNLSLQRWYAVWQNIPFWLQDYWDLGVEGILLRFQRKGGIWRKRLLRRVGVRTEIDAQDLLPDDLSAVPDYHRNLMESHLRALRNYAPGTLHGGVTLYASRGKSISKVLFGSSDPEHGWGSVAGSGVEIKVVDGGHRNIHLQPFVPSLAAALEQSLRAVDDVQ